MKMNKIKCNNALDALIAALWVNKSVEVEVSNEHSQDVRIKEAAKNKATK
jgi:hypothetical protein